ncbi:MAG: phage tail tape measure protein [Proteobacteria bacterium]|nr:phage tail tape measure protein [Pseudomonadota bacterium]
MANAKKYVLTIGAEYEGQSELKKLQTDLKNIGQIDSFEKLRTSWQKTNSEFVQAKAKVRELSQALKNGGGKEVEKQYTAASREVKKLSTSLAKQKGQMDASRVAIQQSGIAMNGLSAAYGKLKASSAGQGQMLAAQMRLGIKATKDVHAEIDGLKRAYAELKNKGGLSMKELAVAKDRLRTKIAELKHETNGWTSHLEKIQVGWAGLLATAGAVAGAFRGVQFFAGFDDSMREVQAVSGAAVGEMERLTGFAKDLGASTRFTATEIGQGMAELAQSGMQTEEIFSTLPDVINLTSASGMQFKESADLLTDTMKQFGLEGSESGRVADVVVKGYTSAGHSAQQLGQALSYVGPIAKAMGYTLEDTVGIIDALAEAGYKGQRGGTALRGGFARLIKPAKEAQEILEKYSIQIYDSEGAIRSFADIIEDLGSAAMNQTEVMTLFGQEAGPGMQALLNVGAQSIRDFQVAMEDAGETAERIAGSKEAGIGGSLRSLMSSLQAIVISFGDSLAPAIQGTSAVLTGLARAIASLPQPVLWLTTAAGGIVTALAAWELGVKHLVNALKLGVIDLLSFAGGISKVASAIAAFSVANPIFAATTAAILAGAAAWAIFAKDSLGASKKHAVAAKKIGEGRKEIDAQVDSLQKLQKVLHETTPESEAHIEAEKKLAEILPDANLSLAEHGELLAKVGDAASENAKKLDNYIGKLKDQSDINLALQLEKQSQAFHAAQEAVEDYKENIGDWYGIGDSSAGFVQKLWLGVNRLSGTYDKNIQKGEEVRANLQEQGTGYRQLIAEMSKAGVSSEDLEKKLNAIHLSDDVKQQIIDDYNAIGEAAKGSAEEASEAFAKAAVEQKAIDKDKLEEMRQEYKKYVDEVKRLQGELTGRSMSLAAELRSMSRTGMSDIGAWKDRKKEAQEYERAAREAAQAGNFDAAVELADKAKEAYRDLNKEVKDGDKVLVSQSTALTDSMAGVKRSGELAVDALEKQQAAAQAAADALDKQSGGEFSGKEGIEAATEATKKLDQMVYKVGDTWHDVSKAAETSWINAALEAGKELDKMAIDRTIKLYIEKIEKSKVGGMIGAVQSLQSGGPVGAIRMALGGGLNVRSALNGFRFAGYGGGDQPKNLVMAENGEVMLKKESVREAGPIAALAFNAGNWKLLLSELLKKFSHKMQLGGPVGRFSIPSLPALPMANGGPVLAGSGESMGHYTHDINFHGAAAPVRVMTDRQNTAAFINGLKRMQELAS